MNETKVLASVNGKDITDKEVFAFLNQLGPQTAAQFSSPEGIKKVADELVNQELLYLEAIERGLDQEEIFKKELEKIKESFLKQYAINKLLSNVNVMQDEIEDFYNKHKEYFQTPEMVRASHILVSNEDSASEIYDEIKNGLSFEEAARKYSSCPSKENGGDLGEFSKGKMVPEFEEAAFSLKDNELSHPIKTQFGYHLIKVSYKKEAGISSLEEAKEQIREQIMRMKQQEIYLNKVDELKNKFEVKTYY